MDDCGLERDGVVCRLFVRYYRRKLGKEVFNLGDVNGEFFNRK